MEAYILALEIAHGEHILLLCHPFVPMPMVPRPVPACPTVIGSSLVLSGSLRIDVPREHMRGIGAEAAIFIVFGLDVGRSLIPDRLTVRQQHWPGVAETAHATHRAEVVVEGAVLLHQDDDVFHVADGTGAAVRRNCQGLANACGQHGRSSRGCSHAKEITSAIFQCHGTLTRVCNAVFSDGDSERNAEGFRRPLSHSITFRQLDKGMWLQELLSKFPQPQLT